MREGEQNRRGRGRNRKGQHHHNPLMRTYQSTGPDQKIHGTPAQIAEKYISLARDAHSSGDPVLAENYLQHAEHYNRIILTYREQQMQQGGDGVNGGRRMQEGYDPEDGDDDGDDMQPEFGAMPSRMDQARGAEPQPRGFDQPPPRSDDRGGSRQQGEGFRDNGHRDREGGQGFRQRGYSSDRGGDRGGDRGPDRERSERQPRQMRDRQPRHDRAERGERGDQFRADRGFAAERPERTPAEEQVEPAEAPRPSPAPRRAERFTEEQHEQPEFLRRPVRRSRKPAAADTSEVSPVSTGADDTAAES